MSKNILKSIELKQKLLKQAIATDNGDILLDDDDREALKKLEFMSNLYNYQKATAKQLIQIGKFMMKCYDDYIDLLKELNQTIQEYYSFTSDSTSNSDKLIYSITMWFKDLRKALVRYQAFTRGNTFMEFRLLFKDFYVPSVPVPVTVTTAVTLTALKVFNGTTNASTSPIAIGSIISVPKPQKTIIITASSLATDGVLTTSGVTTELIEGSIITISTYEYTIVSGTGTSYTVRPNPSTPISTGTTPILLQVPPITFAISAGSTNSWNTLETVVSFDVSFFNYSVTNFSQVENNGNSFEKWISSFTAVNVNGGTTRSKVNSALGVYAKGLIGTNGLGTKSSSSNPLASNIQFNSVDISQEQDFKQMTFLSSDSLALRNTDLTPRTVLTDSSTLQNVLVYFDPEILDEKISQCQTKIRSENLTDSTLDDLVAKMSQVAYTLLNATLNSKAAVEADYHYIELTEETATENLCFINCEISSLTSIDRDELSSMIEDGNNLKEQIRKLPVIGGTSVFSYAEKKNLQFGKSCKC